MVEIIKVVDAARGGEIVVRQAHQPVDGLPIEVKRQRLAALRRWFRIKYGKDVLFTYKEK